MSRLFCDVCEEPPQNGRLNMVLIRLVDSGPHPEGCMIALCDVCLEDPPEDVEFFCGECDKWHGVDCPLQQEQH